MSKSSIALAVAAGALAVTFGWRMLMGGVSSASLVNEALSMKEPAERQRAALQLIAQGGARDHLKELLEQSDDPAVRAIAVQGMADRNDVALIELFFELLEDSNATVRASAVNALDRLMRCRTFIPSEGPEEERRAAIDRARRRWELIEQYGLKEELASATSLAYYYDQHTQTVFEAPSSLPSAVPVPQGPYQGMPAAVRAAVFTAGDSRDPAGWFAGWLSVDDYVLEEHGMAVPERPADSESTLIKLPGDSDWVYAASPAGQKVVGRALAAGKKTMGKEVWRCPRPGRIVKKR